MKFKKIVAALTACALVAFLCVGLAGCGSDNGGSDAEYTTLTPGVLTCAGSPDYPPFENLVDGDWVGFEVELVETIAAEMGLEVQWNAMQFDAILAAISAGGQADMGVSGFTITPDRQETVDFTVSFYTDDQAIATRIESSYTADNAATELNKPGVKIACQSGTTGETYCQENFPEAEVVSYSGSNDCFAALSSGQVDAACTNMAVVDSMMAAYTDCQIVINVATGENYGFAISKDNPGLTAIFNKYIEQYMEDGTMDEIKAKYF